MRAIVTVDVDIDNARKSLEVAGYYNVRNKTDEEVCKMAIKMNDCYAVNTEEIKICEKSESKELEQEPKTGHWYRKHSWEIYFTCSECGTTNASGTKYNYCPSCGARMVEPQERSDKE